ncbi:MAG: hypothetical protein DCC55_27515 [Chloroflexi bacterium]|nr:MAG: hypothetical protein DCC55_27515 [Chloroflexota bacterium]
MEHITGWRRSQSRPATKTGWMTRGSSAAQIDPQSFLTIQVDAKFMLEFSIFSFEGQVRQIVVDDIPYTIMPVTLTCAPNLVEHQLLWQQTITPLKLLLNSNVGPVRSARPNLKRTGPIRCNSIKNWLSSALGMPDGGQKHRRQRNVIVVKPFGLVGVGGNTVGSRRGLSHARHLAALDAGQIVAVCDLVAEAAQSAAAQLNATAYTDFERFLRHGIDVVILATPDNFHARQAALALEAGVGVISEVPATTTVADGRRLVQAFRKSGGFYMLLENYGYRDEIELIRRMVQAGKFGDVYFGEGEYIHDCRGLNRFADGSLTWRGRQFSTYVYIWHSLRPLLYILDDRPTRVSAMTTLRPGRPRRQRGGCSRFASISSHHDRT